MGTKPSKVIEQALQLMLVCTSFHYASPCNERPNEKDLTETAVAKLTVNTINFFSFPVCSVSGFFSVFKTILSELVLLLGQLSLFLPPPAAVFCKDYNGFDEILEAVSCLGHLSVL